MEKQESENKEVSYNKQYKHDIVDISKYNISKVNNNEDISLMNEITYKAIVIGDIGVGKESIIQRLINDSGAFNENYKATIGFDIFKYKCKVNDLIINLNIWDTCGLTDFSSCTPNTFKDTTLAIVVYSIDNKESFEHLENWVNLLKENARPDKLVFIVGNNNDLEDKRQVKEEEGKAFMEERDFNYFIETSAKDNKFIKELFQQAFAQLYEYYYKRKEDSKEDNRDDFIKRISIKKEDHKKRKKKKC